MPLGRLKSNYQLVHSGEGIRNQKQGVLMTDKYKPKNRIEFLEMIDRMYERKYENVNINIRYNGLEIEYDLNDSDINVKHQACFIPYPDF
jgi:hypothetical protein